MDRKQVVSDLQASMQEVIDNLRAIKGEPFANTVAFAHMGLHFARLLSQAAASADMNEEIREILFAQHAQLMEAGLKSIYDGYGMSSEMLDEILDWASKLDDKIDRALEQLSKEK